MKRCNMQDILKKGGSLLIARDAGQIFHPRSCVARSKKASQSCPRARKRHAPVRAQTSNPEEFA